MWSTAATLLWPLLGWFRPGEVTGTWLSRMLYYLSNPYIFFTELGGIVLLLFLANRTHLNEAGALTGFLRSGRPPFAAAERGL